MHATRVGSRFALAGFVVTLALATPVARADTFVFGHMCDDVWQSCCACQADMMCNNWGMMTAMPTCPPLPGGQDMAIVAIDCVIAAPPLPPAAADHLVHTGGTLTIGGNLSVNTATLDGIVELEDGGSLASVAQALQNFGIVQKTSGLGTGIVAGPAGIAAGFVHHEGGLVRGASGTLSFATSVVSSGAFHADAGATIQFSAVTDFNPGATWDGGGRLLLAGGGVNAILRLPNGMNLTTALFQLGNATQSGNISGLGGTTGTLTVTDTMTWQRGTLGANPPLRLSFPQGATISLEGLAPMATSQAILDLAGTANLVSTLTLAGLNTTFNIAPTGVFDIRVDGFVTGTLINNSGLLVKSAGNGVASVSFSTVNNTGVVRSESGVLEFSSVPYTQTSGSTELAGGSLLVNSPLALNGGRLLGAGTIVANITNNRGYVQPGASPGILNVASNANPAVAGNYTQATGGVLDIELGGLTPGSGHDRLVAAGTANLNGTLRVLPVNGFLPQVGQALVVLTAGSRVGTFAAIVGPGQYTATYEPTSVTLNVTAAPQCSDLSPADVNFDCSVSLDDYELLAACMSGPETDTPPMDCPMQQFVVADLDFDGDVDVRDYRAFEALFAIP